MTKLDWTNFNNSTEQKSYDVIPAGTLARVKLNIKPGMYNDPENNWTGGYATQSATGAVYLDCEFTVLHGPYVNRKVWSLIGLHSPKGPTWGEIGHAFIGNILDSAHGFSSKDTSPEAQKARTINGFTNLQGLEFLARIDVEKDTSNNREKNIIKTAITCDHKDYKNLMATVTTPDASDVGTDITPAWNM